MYHTTMNVEDFLCYNLACIILCGDIHTLAPLSRPTDLIGWPHIVCVDRSPDRISLPNTLCHMGCSIYPIECTHTLAFLPVTPLGQPHEIYWFCCS